MGLLVAELALAMFLLPFRLLLTLLLAFPCRHFGVEYLFLFFPPFLPSPDELVVFSLSIRGKFDDIFSGFGFGFLGVAITLLVLLFFNEVCDHSSKFIEFFLL